MRWRGVSTIAAALMLVLVLAAGIPGKAVASGYQQSPPWWDHHDFYYTWYENSGFLNSDIGPIIAGGGYAAWVEKNKTASYAKSVMPYDAVYSFDGHGNRTTLRYWNGSSSSYLYASDIRYNIPDLADLRLAIFNGCKTAQNPWDTSSHGLLYSAVIDREVDCAVGFQNTVYFVYKTWWYYYLYQKLIYDQLCVTDAVVAATALTIFYHGTDGGMLSHYEMGASGLKVIPASYGT